MKNTALVILLTLVCFFRAEFALATTSHNFDSFAYEDLVLLVQNSHIASIEELLPSLPESFRSGYTLMHKSRSLQEASFLNPRVIMFGRNASLTCSFNGSPDQNGFDTLECFQFQKETRSFDFHEIQFPTIKNKLKNILFSKSGESASQINMNGKKQFNTCHACHTQDLRPNWNAYSNWPGAYGADDDFLRDDKNQYAEFVKIRGTHPRYRWLIQGSEASAPYIENSFGIMSRPNLRFSDFIGRMNGLRTSRILENKASKWQILAFAHGALKCELSKEQKVRLAGVGFDPASQFDINKILNDLNIKPLVWRTQNFAELGKVADYEHQSGFSYLSISTSMAILTKRAVLGDSEFQRGLQRIDDFVKSNYTGDYLDFFSALNKILHDPERFSNSYPKNLENFCPRLSQIFTDEYMSSNIH